MNNWFRNARCATVAVTVPLCCGAAQALNQIQITPLDEDQKVGEKVYEAFLQFCRENPAQDSAANRYAFCGLLTNTANPARLTSPPRTLSTA